MGIEERLQKIEMRLSFLEKHFESKKSQETQLAEQLTKQVETYYFINQKPITVGKLSSAYARRLKGYTFHEFVNQFCPTLEIYFDGARQIVQPRKATNDFDPTTMTAAELNEFKKLESELKPDATDAVELPEEFFKK